MIIDYFSDPHINHWMLWNENQIKFEKRTRAFTSKLIENGHGEVLIIAGDFSEWNAQSLWMLDEAAKQYQRVYFTYGNHDLYLLSKNQKKKYGDSIGRLTDFIEKVKSIPNVVPLIKTIDVYKGKVFAGDALWYIPKSEKDWHFYRDISNDSNYISIYGCSRDGIPKKLNRESMSWYKTLEGNNIDVFVSHVPPVSNPHSPFDRNACYMVDVPFINTRHWICGHDHLQLEFQKDGVQFHMNAIGYPQHYSNYPRRNVIPEGKIDEYKSFGIKSFEI